MIPSVLANEIKWTVTDYLDTTFSFQDEQLGDRLKEFLLDPKHGMFKGWDEEQEIRLLNFLDRLNEKGIKFALSNVFENKGLRNDLLIQWCERNEYFVYPISSNYSNSSYHRKDRNTSLEVLITNYDVRSIN